MSKQTTTIKKQRPTKAQKQAVSDLSVQLINYFHNLRSNLSA